MADFKDRCQGKPHFINYLPEVMISERRGKTRAYSLEINAFAADNICRAIWLNAEPKYQVYIYVSELRGLGTN